MIRPAIHSDRTRIVQLLHASHVAAGFDRADGPTGFVFTFDPSYAARLFYAHLDQTHAVSIVIDVDGVAQGILMAMAFEHPYADVRLAKETVWWIDPAHRGRSAVRMLDAYEAWWRAQGCAFGGMAGMGEDPNVGHLLRRRGYRPAETHYLKAA